MSTFTDLGPFLTITEAAALLRLSRSAAYILGRRSLETGGREASRRCASAGRSAFRRWRSTVGQRPAVRLRVIGGRRLAVVVGPDAGAWVRRVGPTAWVVLETLVAVRRWRHRDRPGEIPRRRARPVQGHRRRALLGLRQAGLVEPCPVLRDAGRFTWGGYRLHLPPHPLEPAASTCIVDACPPRAPRRVRRHLSAPKSVSVLFGLGDPEIAAAVRDAHKESVDAAFGYLDRHAARSRRGRDGVEQVVGDGLVAAGIRHRTSRAGDPHLPPTSWWATRSGAPTASGARWTPASSTPTPRRPATCTRRTCAICSPNGSASSGDRS